MELDKLKHKAKELGILNSVELNSNVQELKSSGISFLGCVAFVQTNQNLTLSEALTRTLELECWTKNDKERFNSSIRLMMGEFNDDE